MWKLSKLKCFDIFSLFWYFRYFWISLSLNHLSPPSVALLLWLLFLPLYACVVSECILSLQESKSCFISSSFSFFFFFDACCQIWSQSAICSNKTLSDVGAKCAGAPTRARSLSLLGFPCIKWRQQDGAAPRESHFSAVGFVWWWAFN